LTLNQASQPFHQEQSMPLNSYITLGNSGLRVSQFCLGTMTFGEDWGWGATPEGSSKIIGTFLERGGNLP
jgi:aryl-alcohol dehydrogenase-like predicted oxidoreductase